MTQLTLAEMHSKHFRLRQLADGVYAAIHVGGGAAISNAGIIDLGDRTLIFDAFFTPQAAADLRARADEITGRPVDMVVDSHYHNDHIWGNQAFSPDTDIISTVETRQLIATRGMGELGAFKENAAANLESVQTEYRASHNEDQRRQVSLWLDYYQGFLEAEPILGVRLPNLTFTQRLLFHGTERSAELITFAGGHSESDAVLFLPQERILFTSDLLFIECHPWLGGGDPEEWLRILGRMAELNPEIVVPGHGPVGAKDSLETIKQYISTLDRLAHKMVAGGKGETGIADTRIPEPFANWLGATFFAANMRFLYQRQLGNETGTLGGEAKSEIRGN